MANLYGGLTTPHWNQIDKIHIGPFTKRSEDKEKEDGLIGLDPNDEILIGRYVLVKYLEDTVYTQDDKNLLMNSKFTPAEGSKAETWQKCYNVDKNDYDGVVFIKTLRDDKLSYEPIARLSTNFSQDYIRTGIIGIEQVQDSGGNYYYPTVKTYVDNKDEATKDRIDVIVGNDEGTSIREIAQEEDINRLGDIPSDKTVKQYIGELKISSSDNAEKATVKEYIDSKDTTIIDTIGSIGGNNTDTRTVIGYVNGLNTTTNNRIDTLVGEEKDDDSKSVRTIAAEEVAKIVLDADEKLDTLEEIANWILNDTTGAAKMQSDIEELQTTTKSHTTSLETQSGQIEDLQTNINAHDGRISTLETNVGNHDSTLTEHGNRITSVENLANKNEQSIETEAETRKDKDDEIEAIIEKMRKVVIEVDELPQIKDAVPNAVYSIPYPEEEGYRELNVVTGLTTEEQGWTVIGYTSVNRIFEEYLNHEIEDRKAADTDLSSQIQDLQSQIDDILYEAIEIIEFHHNKGIVEIGTTVDKVILTWKINKTPTTLTLDEKEINTGIQTTTITDLSITHDNNKIWTLKAVDERKAFSEKTTTITFCNNIYYGVSNAENGFTSDFITSLSKRLSSNKAYSFTVTPENQYIYYAVPKRLGTVSFKVGGFEGGFVTPDETVKITNNSGYTEDYYVYRSANLLTGKTDINAI